MPLLESPAGSGQNPVPPTRNVVAQFRVGAECASAPFVFNDLREAVNA